MNIDEQVIGSMAEAYTVIRRPDGQGGTIEERYQLFNLLNFESSIKVTTKKKGLLGRTGKVTYPTGWEGTWKATLSYNFPVFRQFKNSGKFPSFDIMTVNENTKGTIGRQSVIHRGCYIDSAILSKIDVDTEDELKEDISGTFNDFEIPEGFNVMDGMLQ